MESVRVELTSSFGVGQLYDYASAVIVCGAADLLPRYCPCKAVADHWVTLALYHVRAHPAAFLWDCVGWVLCADCGPEERSLALKSFLGAVVSGVIERLY